MSDAKFLSSLSSWSSVRSPESHWCDKQVAEASCKAVGVCAVGCFSVWLSSAPAEHDSAVNFTLNQVVVLHLSDGQRFKLRSCLLICCVPEFCPWLFSATLCM